MPGVQLLQRSDRERRARTLELYVIRNETRMLRASELEHAPAMIVVDLRLLTMPRSRRKDHAHLRQVELILDGERRVHVTAMHRIKRPAVES